MASHGIPWHPMAILLGMGPMELYPTAEGLEQSGYSFSVASCSDLTHCISLLISFGKLRLHPSMSLQLLASSVT
eukprot:Skav216720  [mRNA]  locus=scaffold91:774755:776082:- [translate_table: standard]